MGATCTLRCGSAAPMTVNDTTATCSGA
jgi:hypothetical protein